MIVGSGRRHLAIIVIFAVSVTVIGGEVAARTLLGLGDPPLYESHRDIEYLMVPGTYQRFGNRITVNRYGQRAPEPHGERRVLVVGDSVVNGGSLTDDQDLATWVASDGLDAWVGNASAGSWGPPNMAAYVATYGLFDADVLIVVLSSGDSGDVPTFSDGVGVDPALPKTRPRSALAEGVTRYVIPRLTGGQTPEEPDLPPVSPDPEALDGLRRLLAHCSDADVPAVVVLHPTKSQLATGYDPNAEILVEVADAHGAHVVPLADRLSGADYRDSVHLDDSGQRELAQVIVEVAGPHLE